MTRWMLTVALAGFLIAARAPLAHAHEGHPHKTMGTVTMLHENHLEVKDAKGKTTTFPLSPKTKITRGTAKAQLEDIKVGDRVVVTSTETKGKDGKVVVNVTLVQLGVGPAPAAAKK